MHENFGDSTAGVAAEIANGDELTSAMIARDKNLHIATVFRWIVRGLPAATGGRIKLEALRRGRKWLTSRAALRRFFAALPSNSREDSPVCREIDAQTSKFRSTDAKSQLKDRFGI